MNQRFEIKFDFPLAHSDLLVSLMATVEIHHSDTYYVVDNFHFLDKSSGPSILPTLELKQVPRGSSKVWVHKDSGRETLLGLAIGKAIDKAIENK